jgi:NAD(P)-dependent dehydrogenase (short-subunit alcohol dehydrogenase family)
MTDTEERSSSPGPAAASARRRCAPSPTAGDRVWGTMRDAHGTQRGQEGRAGGLLPPHRHRRDGRHPRRLGADGFARILAEGPVDILINNAGIMYIGMTEAYSVAQAAEQMDTNYFGAIRAMQAVLPSMRAAGSGLIINTSSIAGRVSVPFFGTYCATKHALEAYSQSLRYEVAPFGIDVALVEPGPFPSNLLAAGKPPARADVLSSYGDLGQVPATMIAGFAEMLRARKPPTRNWSSTPISRWPTPRPASAPRARSSASPGAWTR